MQHIAVRCHNVLQQFSIFVVLLASQYTTRFGILKGYLLSSVDNPLGTNPYTVPISQLHQLIANKKSSRKSLMLGLLMEHASTRWQRLFISKKIHW